MDIKRTRTVWPIDCGPTRDFPRSVRVCIVGVSASHATKHCLATLIDPENPDPKVADALHISEEELRQILGFHLRETREEQSRTTGYAR